MFEILITGIFIIALLITYTLTGFIIAMLIQGITYWTTGFSIYNYLMKKVLVALK